MSGRKLRAPDSHGGDPGRFEPLAASVHAGNCLVARVLAQKLGLI
jgi:hypothetical protein